MSCKTISHKAAKGLRFFVTYCDIFTCMPLGPCGGITRTKQPGSLQRKCIIQAAQVHRALEDTALPAFVVNPPSNKVLFAVTNPFRMNHKGTPNITGRISIKGWHRSIGPYLNTIEKSLIDVIDAISDQ